MTWLDSQPEEEDEASMAAVGKVLRLISATLQFNKMSPEEGFAEFDSDSDGWISLFDLCSTSNDLCLELSERELTLAHASLRPDEKGLVSLQVLTPFACFCFPANPRCRAARPTGGRVGPVVLTASSPQGWTQGLMGVDATSELRERGVDPSAIPSPVKVPSRPQQKERSAASRDGKPIVSPVGEYIKTGAMPEARVRRSGGVTASRESRGERGSKDGAVMGGINDGDDALYEEDFEDVHDEDDNERDEMGEVREVGGGRLTYVAAVQQQGRPSSAKIVDAIDWRWCSSTCIIPLKNHSSSWGAACAAHALGQLDARCPAWHAADKAPCTRPRARRRAIFRLIVRMPQACRRGRRRGERHQ